MIDKYGSANGFGWQLNQIIGAQVVSVPMSVPIDNTNRAFVTFLLSLCAVFVVLYVALNVMLSRLIVRPVTEMARMADAVSTGDFDMPEFNEKGRSEINHLGASFNRMRRSLEQAMRMID
jgi:protein-histidine pros-kinase